MNACPAPISGPAALCSDADPEACRARTVPQRKTATDGHIPHRPDAAAVRLGDRRLSVALTALRSRAARPGMRYWAASPAGAQPRRRSTSPSRAHATSPPSCQGLALVSTSCRGKGSSRDTRSLSILRSPRLRLGNSWMPGPRPGMTSGGRMERALCSWRLNLTPMGLGPGEARPCLAEEEAFSRLGRNSIPLALPWRAPCR
jgi:hypothetical protein